VFLKIQSYAFRNLQDTELDFNPAVNILVGENGQGKSNLVEALCLLSTGDSFRDFENESLIKNNFEQASIRALAFSRNLEYSVDLRISEKSRTYSLNGKRTSAAKLSSIFQLVTFSPDSLNAIKQGTDLRRRLVDEIVDSFDPAKAEALGEFRKALSYRNKVLKSLQEEPSNKDHMLILEAINPKYLELCAAVCKARLDTLKAITPFYQASHLRFAGLNQAAELGFRYLMSGKDLFGLSNREIHNSMQNRMQELRSAEISSGVSLVGPHRHEIEFLSHGKDSRYYCSQGQQRALIIALKLAQIMYHKEFFGNYPVLILDDVLSELDEVKRGSLVQFLQNIETQVFITTTDLSLPSEFLLKDSLVLKVEGGTFSRL